MLTNDYNRLQELHAQVREEKLEFKDQLSAELRIINQKNKVISSAIDLMALAIKCGAKSMVKTEIKNILGDTSNIKAPLPLYDRTIDRGHE